MRLDPASGIDVHGRRLSIADDLSLLPEPFVRRGVGGGSAVPFVFAENPDWTMLRAAGIAASWFGVQAQDRGPRFDVRVGELPTGNAVVLLVGAMKVGGLQAGDASSVRITTNPADSFGKLLVFSAPNELKLVELMQSLATNQIKLDGAEADEAGFVLPEARRSDDAPAWVQGNRVALSKAPGGESLVSNATDQALLYLRFAPDLNFGARNDSYLSLHYAAGPGVVSPLSNIAVSLNGAKADSVPLRTTATGGMQTANIPVGELPFLFRNTLTARLYPMGKSADPCAAAPSDFQASISGGSFLDLGNVSHLSRLPDLRSFSNAGFPFTRYADLGQTAVLLPQHPDAATIALYLDLLGYFGAQTGYPALRVTVTAAENAAQFADKDMLLLGSYDDTVHINEALSPLSEKPWTGKLSMRAAGMVWLRNLLHLSDVNVASLQEDASGAQGVIEGAKSPYGSGRSLMVVLWKTPETLAAMSGAMLDAMPLDSIRGRASFWSDSNFHSYELSGENYLVGDAPVGQKLEFWMAFHPWLPALLLLAVCALAGVWIQNWVKYRRRYRLEGVVPNQALEVQ